MPNQEEKPAKARTRSRKGQDQKTSKAAPKRQTLPEQARRDQVALDADAVSPMTAQPEETPVEVAALDVAPVEAALVEAAAIEAAAAEAAAAIEAAPVEAVLVAVAVEPAPEAALSGEVFPPQTQPAAPQAPGFSAIAQAYGEYTRKSWLAGRFLVERLIAVRSFDEAIEIESEFTRQVYANFIGQSQKICMLYGEWAAQFFRPLEKFPAGWPRRGR